ncbi:MAG: RsmB/NOP family class I SAM-dependent RNA methyltransferase [Streptosporangiales bacterium]
MTEGTGARRVDPARRAAYDTLRAVHARDAYANLVLPRLLSERQLVSRDAAFATELAYGTLRQQGLYDAVLAECARRPVARLDPPLLDVLRLGVHQILRTRVPAHAAVSATVELARAALGPRPVKLANAVLRKACMHDEEGWVRALAPSRESDPAGYLSLAHAHPRWVVEAFHAALGSDWDETEAALTADNEPADVVLCARRCDRDELGGRLGRWSPYAVVADGDPGSLEAVRAGLAGVQDEGSQLVAMALAAAEVPRRASREVWLDACAGPGGKAALLSVLGAERGARVLAAERRPARAALVHGALAGTGGAAAVVADSRDGPWCPATFDRVLVDAPCTGLGALRRRPEARWRRRADDVRALAAIQKDLLRGALASVRPGGVVAYATCSPHPAETTGIVGEVVTETPDAEVEDARELLPGVPDLGPGPSVQLWPHRHGTDAMFLTVVRRTPAAGSR